MRRTILIIAVLGIAIGTIPVAGAQSAEAYSGTHVSFETEANSITGYTINGNTLFSNVTVGSASDSSLGVDTDLSASAVTSVNAAGLSIASQTQASATVEAEGGAEIRSHDNNRGHLIVKTGDSDQQVVAELGDGSSAESESGRVVVTTADGTTATAFVVGDGEVAVNDNGDLSADLKAGAELVVRSNGDQRDEDDRQQVSIIESGQATAELHVQQQDGERVDDTITYGEETSLTVSQQAENTVELTVDRTSEEGTVVLTTVSESVIENGDNIQVDVDGEAAVEASSYSELESTAAGNNGSAYFVTESSAEASTDVHVAIDHFSERTVTMESTDSEQMDSNESMDEDDSTTDDGSGDGEEATDDGSEDDEETTGNSAPGFGAAVTLVALLSAAAALGRRE